MPPKAHNVFSFGHSDRADALPPELIELTNENDEEDEEDEDDSERDFYEDELQNPETLISRLECVDYDVGYYLLKDAGVFQRHAWPDRKLRVWDYEKRRWVLDEHFWGPWVYPAWHGEKAIFYCSKYEMWEPAIWRDEDTSLGLEAGWEIGLEPDRFCLRHR